MGIGNKQTSDAERQKRRRQRLADVGIKPMTVQFPEPDRFLVRDLSRRVLDGQPIRQAMRVLSGVNEPETDASPVELLVELDAARNRIAEVEREAEKRRVEIEERDELLRAAHDRAVHLQAERDAARAAEVEGRAKIDAVTVEAKEAATAAQEAQGRATEALQRAVKAETAFRQAKTMPGIKGWLVRWLVAGLADRNR
ncbi:MAG TPA: hypothetical protein PK677_17745 [Acidiphilium sp.]|jgi:hypothetical protein|nr:MAG: hypothetical protein B7Z59_07645 [Acidiphilium sp. 37-67-22]HQT90347.1 hypothetical protein [Acidiphilium sp.]